MVLSRFPVEAGVPPRFTVLDERSAAELMRAARHAVLERAGAGEAPLTRCGRRARGARGTTGASARSSISAIGQAGPVAASSRRKRRRKRFFAHLRAKAGHRRRTRTRASVLAQFCAELGAANEPTASALAQWLVTGAREATATPAHGMTEFLEIGNDAGRVRASAADLLHEGRRAPRNSFVTQDTRRTRIRHLRRSVRRCAPRGAEVEQRRRAAITGVR